MSELLGHVMENAQGDFLTACRDCADETTDRVDGEIRDGIYYGTTIPYPECFYCQRVIRPDA